MIAKIAVHGGPRAALAPLPGKWATSLRGVTVLLRGTSELPASRNPETRLAKEALRRGIPVYAVEDFPGNWRGEHELSGLFVEFPRKADCPVHVVGNARYALKPRAPKAPRKEPLVLWLGQPDQRVDAGNLRLLRPAVKALGARLEVRRHPRAGGGGPEVAEADLVVTSFSSLAVEAGFLGIPALFMLLPGLGADYLESRTGRRTLPWVEEGAAFGVTSARKLKDELRRALDPRERRRVLARFARIHAPARQAARRIKELL